jgi:hypothetical protein
MYPETLDRILGILLAAVVLFFGCMIVLWPEQGQLAFNAYGTWYGVMMGVAWTITVVAGAALAWGVSNLLRYRRLRRQIGDEMITAINRLHVTAARALQKPAGLLFWFWLRPRLPFQEQYFWMTETVYRFHSLRPGWLGWIGLGRIEINVFGEVLGEEDGYEIRILDSFTLPAHFGNASVQRYVVRTRREGNELLYYRIPAEDTISDHMINIATEAWLGLNETNAIALDTLNQRITGDLWPRRQPNGERINH